MLGDLPQHVRPIVMFAYHTGWSLTEILTLQWDQVDLKECIVRLEPGDTKNDEGRTLYMDDELIAMMKGLYKSAANWLFICVPSERPGDKELQKGMKECGIKVEAFGEGWTNGPLSTEDMIGMYSKSKINLGFSGVAGHRDTYCIKGRDFEIPMSGGLYLTEYNPELEKFFDVGKEIAVYKTFDELLEKIRYFLSNPEKAEIIRKNGFQRACRDHTWEMRFEKVFTLLGLI